MAMDTPTYLKQNTLEGCLVELQLPEPMVWSAKLEGLPYVRECSIHGPMLHVLLVNSAAIQALEQYTGVAAKPITPSLEDVFLALSRKDKRGVLE